jgi:hypothetical protein
MTNEEATSISGYHIVRINDWSALEDTRSAVAVSAAALLIVTIVLNAFNVIIWSKINRYSLLN